MLGQSDKLKFKTLAACAQFVYRGVPGPSHMRHPLELGQTEEVHRGLGSNIGNPPQLLHPKLCLFSCRGHHRTEQWLVRWIRQLLKSALNRTYIVLVLFVFLVHELVCGYTSRIKTNICFHVLQLEASPCFWCLDWVLSKRRSFSFRRHNKTK